jgi:hypothetical protein
MRHLMLSVSAFLWLLLSPALAFGWASATGFETHQYILRTAYDELAKSNALPGSGFPVLADVLAHEGVYYLGDGESIWSPSYVGGPGPDHPGTSNDADHYYNPRISRGGGPAAAARYYRYIAKGIASAVSADEAVKKGAAWGAHFMADMSVPFHVNGLPKTDAVALYNSAGGTRSAAVNLDPKISGNRVSLSYNLASPHDANFKKEIERWMTEATKPENTSFMDWFDPWYWNGIASESKGSSHIEWEMAVAVANYGNYGLSGYSPGWKNPAPTFDNPWDAQAPQISALAVSAASMASTETPSWMQNARPALDQSIQDVVTLWRASISGLRPDLRLQPLPPDPNPAPGTGPIYLLKGEVMNTERDDSAEDVEIRVTILSGAKFTEGDNTPQKGGTLGPGAADVDIGQWKIELTDMQKGAQLQVEAIASYTKVPDLQYATKFITLKPPAFDGSYNGKFTGTSGSSGSIRFTVKAGSVTGTISGIYDSTPTDGTFSGTVDAAGNMKTTLNGIIHNGTPDHPWDIKYAGEVNGTLSPTGGVGSWWGKNAFGNPTGNWNASKQ